MKHRAFIAAPGAGGGLRFTSPGVRTRQGLSSKDGAEVPAASLLAHAGGLFACRPFAPHPLLPHGDAQTIAAHFWPRSPPHGNAPDDHRLFRVDTDTRVLAHCRWQTERSGRPTLLLWHGIEGSASSPYMMGTAEKAFRAGFNVVRVNVRNCGATEHLSPTLYHGGLTSDLKAVIEELVACDRFTQLYVAGFSLGGNMALKLAGEYGDSPPPELKAVCAISPPVDLGGSCTMLQRRRNLLYHLRFLRGLRSRLLTKEKLFPGTFHVADLSRIRSIEDFDELYTAPLFGFRNAADYYARSSALPLIDRVGVPCLIIQAADDPIVPVVPELAMLAARNPQMLLILTEHGGHVGFVSRATGGEDHFWAENRLVEFCRLIASR